MRHLANLLLLTLLAHAPAHAGNVEVNTTADGGPGSLRSAIAEINANGGGVITFAESFPLEGSINLASALPAFTAADVEVRGGDRFPRIDGGGLHRIFRADPSTVRLQLSDLVLRNGRGGLDEGGCLHGEEAQEGGDLVLERVDFVQCLVEQEGEAAGGAIRWERSGGAVSVSHAIFFRNRARSTSESGSAIGGAMFLDAQSLVLRRSVFLENATGGGQASSSGGALYLSRTSQVLIEDSEFAANNTFLDGASGAGGAITLRTLNSQVQIARSAFRGNFAQSGGAISASASFLLEVGISIANTSFFDNEAVTGGSLWIDSAFLDAVNTSFYNSSANQGAHLWKQSRVRLGRFQANLLGPTFSGDACGGPGDWQLADATITANLLLDDSCPEFAVDALPAGPLGSIVYDESPGLVPVLRFDGSAVIDAIADASLCEPEDARGTSRPRDGNDDGIARCDVGAFEDPGPLLFANGFES